VLCDSGEAALKQLFDNQEYIDVVILDRMMPGISGVDVIKKAKADRSIQHIPIIMQTASNEKAHLEEGFKLGVYHYLVKPYLPDVFNAIVRAAIDFYTLQRTTAAKLRKAQILSKCVETATFKVKSLRDADEMSIGLAQLFPEPSKVALGISEILVNAIEHGNLNITYEEKSKLNLECRWKDEVEKRLTLPENKDKFVIVTLHKNENQIILNVKDQGRGFDYSKFMKFDADRSTDNHGRGIAFANALSFDTVQYVGCGNEVVCTINIH
jgi:DNA-binding response OmpR family regulator